jgi:hypothetical protein
MTDVSSDRSRRANVSSARIEELLNLAVAGLAPMFCPQSQLFCYRRKLSRAGLVNEGLSLRYTMMSLLGLARREMSGQLVPIDTRAVLRGLLKGRAWTRNLGDLGLLLWLCGATASEFVPNVCDGLVLRDFIMRFRGSCEGRTMELAWLLAGLAHVKLSARWDTPCLTNSAFDAYQLLGKNQGPYGIFGHSVADWSLRGMLRGRIGSFADQVYPIYALAKFGQAYGVRPPLEMARRCSEAICRMQGPSGQWWWHYDARTGRVFERYPVYSVHQHGMAPMALFTLGDATGIDYSDAIYSGLSWVTETNELGRNLSDGERQMIWRSLYRGSRLGISTTRALSLLGKEDRTIPGGSLLVRWECRPYELAWLLYAFSGRSAEAGRP